MDSARRVFFFGIRARARRRVYNFFLSDLELAQSFSPVPDCGRKKKQIPYRRGLFFLLSQQTSQKKNTLTLTQPCATRGRGLSAIARCQRIAPRDVPSLSPPHTHTCVHQHINKQEMLSERKLCARATCALRGQTAPRLHRARAVRLALPG